MYVGLTGLQPTVDKVGLYSLSAAGVTHGLVSELCDQTQQSLTLELCMGQKGETEATSRTNFIEKHKSGNLLIFFFQRRRAPPTWLTRGRSLSRPTWRRSRISRLVFDCFYISSFYHRHDQGCSAVFKFKFHLFLSLGTVRERSDAS